MAEPLKKVTVSMMNAVHDPPLLVARDDGFFRDEGLDVTILKTPGSGQFSSDHQALRANIFDRTMEQLYDQGQCDQFRMCEWGVMKRAVNRSARKAIARPRSWRWARPCRPSRSSPIRPRASGSRSS